MLDNLLGSARLCPTTLRTAHLDRHLASRLDEEARAVVEPYDPALIARATSYLYTKETPSSFAIEGETPTANRAARFVAALRSAAKFDPSDPAAITALQNAIVDPRYAATGWRDIQNFVGKTTVGFGEQVHYVCPKPGDVADLMQGWMDLTERVVADRVDPVVAAAVAAFSFVLVHPFEDGNGGIHRFMIHQILSRTRFSPGDMIFPISAAILRDQRGYDAVLETFSQPLLALIDWDRLPTANSSSAARPPGIIASSTRRCLPNISMTGSLKPSAPTCVPNSAFSPPSTAPEPLSTTSSTCRIVAPPCSSAS